MGMFRTGTVAAPITIIGKDLDIGATFNADVKPAQPAILKAGTIVKYDATTKQFDKFVGGGGTPDAVTLIFGILADDVDATHATEIQPAMCYRKGTFLRQEIESANDLLIAPGGTIDVGLKDVGIFLELSYESYQGLSPVPTGAVTTPPFH